ncbi:MAG: hypothetical protein FXF47_06470 [Candidatus Mcinerneyibacterium aminivorans]|uniref:Uncharacterized protein n=1 Tax=Candidatus Mcinerneyibacterium aminivorans TaxID=2703815 RepID=A0A5D0MF74_9BACT|nr:MAG: hypothetical protein FXF47_06470 [Candidatus Mcinerneyibacterium aminivorans]
MNRKGGTLLTVMVFMLIFITLLGAYVLKSFYFTQEAELEIDYWQNFYALESNMQRAIRLVEETNRKDLGNSDVVSQNWEGTYGTDFTISVKEFDNWAGYVENNNESLNEVNASSNTITRNYPVSIQLRSLETDTTIEYLMSFGSGIPFTIYAHNSIGIDYDENRYPYLSSSYSWDVSHYANDTRVESSTVYYSNTIYCSTSNTESPNWSGKLDSSSTLEQKTLTLPTFFTMQGNQGYNDLVASIDPSVNIIDYKQNSINYSQMMSAIVSGTTNVFITKKNSFDINIDTSLSNEITEDIIFIVRGDVNLSRNFWVDKNGRLGIISFNNINMEPTNYYDKMGGNIFLYASNNINFLAESNSGSNIIVGKLLSGNDIILDGTDYNEFWIFTYENTSGDDFDYNSTDYTLKDLSGLNITDNPDIFNSPRPLPFNIEYGGSGGGASQRIWRQR